MKKLELIIVSLSLLLAIWSCKKDEDKPKPVVDNTRPIISNVTTGKADNTFQVGQTIQLRARLSDDTELGQYKVEIHENFDGHSHGKTSSTTPFEYKKIVNISGKAHDLVQDIKIPENAASGPYHLLIYCLDKQGNEAEFVLIDLNITNSSQPVINITRINGKDASKEVHLHEIGSDTVSLQPEGDITDSDGLAKVKIKVVEAKHSHGKNSEDHVWEWEQENNLSNRLDITALFRNNPIRFRLTKDGKPANENHYDLMFIAKDKLGNYSMQVVEIHAEK
ncbi:MAG: DUF4625 domain-containing protein [Bacteroidia bacterium]|nr:DUF4625 domain-containing protein [Bacteroidia bacterium]MDW8157809.1 DUF4625 domain-containing protein [Bacteroidia bacterium]